MRVASEDRESRDAEQNEALSLVMTPKKKRHKVNIFHIFLHYLFAIFQNAKKNKILTKFIKYQLLWINIAIHI